MGDPVFKTREAMNVWERCEVAAILDNAWNPEVNVIDMIATANRIQRVRDAHAHLFKESNDAGLR